MVTRDDDRALRAAEERAREAATSIEELEAQMRMIAARISDEKAELRRLRRFIDSWHAVVGSEPSSPRGRPRNPKYQEVASLALEEIRRAGKPIGRRDLLARLTGNGLVLAGKDPEMILGTMLYRDDRIVRLRDFGYWEAAAVYEPAFYWPEHEQVIGAADDEGSNPVGFSDRGHGE